MKTLVLPESPFATRPESTYKSGNVVQTNWATSLPKGGNRLVSQAKMLYFDLMLKVPWRWRVALMNKLRRALISY